MVRSGSADGPIDTDADPHADAHDAMGDDDDTDLEERTWLDRAGITPRQLKLAGLAAVVTVLGVSLLNNTDPATVVGNVVDAVPPWVWDSLRYAIPLSVPTGVASYYLVKRLVDEKGRLLRVHNSGVGASVDLRIGHARLENMDVLKPTFDAATGEPGYTDGELRDLETDLRIKTDDGIEEALEAERYYPDRNVAVATAMGVATARERRTHYNVLERCQRTLKAESDRAQMITDALPEIIREETDRRMHYFIAALEGAREPGEIDAQFTIDSLLERHELGAAIDASVEDPTIRQPGLTGSGEPDAVTSVDPEDVHKYADVDPEEKEQDPDLRSGKEKAVDAAREAVPITIGEEEGDA
jgi:hypothetical protein